VKRTILILLAILVTLPLHSQHFAYTRVDFKQIRSAVAKKKSALYYPVLFDRYQNNDTTLTREEFRYLYYGFTFQEEYQPYAIHDAEDAVSNRLKKDTLTVADFSIIYSQCREILELHPFRTRFLLVAAVACSQMGNAEEATLYYYKYHSILSAILSSGDGATEQSAWSIAFISDEYELIRLLGFTPSGKQKMLAESRCDFISVESNEYAIEGFYFDISRPFARGFK
jgi:hypothetical protein